MIIFFYKTIATLTLIGLKSVLLKISGDRICTSLIDIFSLKSTLLSVKIPSHSTELSSHTLSVSDSSIDTSITVEPVKLLYEMHSKDSPAF